jgi:signal transduction histidine kinase
VRRVFRLPRAQTALSDWRKTMPVLVTIAGLALEPLVGGPGALVFAVPGLLWCAIAYDVAVTALLVFLFAMWTLITITMNFVRLGIPLNTEFDLISLRLGVTLVALGPITVATVMTARNALLREMAAARAAAEDAMASRSLLLATMTHELRSPLAAMIGLAEVMAKQNSGPSGNPKHLDYAQSIEDAGRHLNTLVTDLLDTAKVEAGKIEIAKAPVSSQMVIEQALRLVRGLAMEARVTLIMVPGEWPDVFVDSRTIKQVVVNLVSNAVKFSPHGATVNIESECGTDRLTIKVVDTGKGIAPDELKTLGRAYAQAGSAASRSKGTGLGLALSMQLVEQHGGQLRLQSIPNVGTTAIFDVARDL